MKTIEQKAAELGMEKGYYLLLLAIIGQKED